MSKWGDIRDAVIKHIDVETVTEKTKQDFVIWLSEIVLPVVRPYADKFIAQVREQAEKESGWTKIRDLIVIPFAVEGGLWLIDKFLAKAVANTGDK